MRHLGAWSIHGLPNTTRHTDYRRLISCSCHAQGDGKLSPEHMPELREDEVLIRMLSHAPAPPARFSWSRPPRTSSRPTLSATKPEQTAPSRGTPPRPPRSRPTSTSRSRTYASLTPTCVPPALPAGHISFLASSYVFEPTIRILHVLVRLRYQLFQHTHVHVG